MNPYTIRKLEISDAEALRAIRLEALRLYPDNYTAIYAAEAVHNVAWFAELLSREAIFGAYDSQGNLCATACLTPDMRPRNEHKAVLRMVYVQPRMQGQGLAKKVLLGALEYARVHFEQVLLSVESRNSGAIRLYESLGFTMYGHEPQASKLLDGSYLDDILMIAFMKDAEA